MSGSKTRGAKGHAPGPLFDQFRGALDEPFEDLLKSIKDAPGNESLEDLISGQNDQLSSLQGQAGRLDSLPDQLKRSSLGSTDSASVAALQAAKQAGGGRGGLAFGGGAGAFASRAAQGAATQQSAALAGAIVQGNQASADFELKRQGLIGQNLQGRLGAAGLQDKIGSREIGARSDFLKLIAALGGSAVSGAGGSTAIGEQKDAIGYGGK